MQYAVLRLNRDVKPVSCPYYSKYMTDDRRTVLQTQMRVLFIESVQLQVHQSTHFLGFHKIDDFIQNHRSYSSFRAGLSIRQVTVITSHRPWLALFSHLIRLDC